MSKREFAFFLLVAGIAIHVFGNAKKAYTSFDAKAGIGAWLTGQTTTDYVYYLATAALAVGALILWPSIRPK